jgi:hypothetical protein
MYAVVIDTKRYNDMYKSRPAVTKQFRREISLARKLWPKQIQLLQTRGLKILCDQYDLTLAAGDLLLLNGRWYITHTGLLRLAQRKHCTEMQVQAVSEFCNPESNRWVFKATVYKSLGSRGFTGYGDANPSNVSPLVRGAEMRVAETRAVNRALRKAYGIGLCSVEELGWTSGESGSPQRNHQNGSFSRSNGNGHSGPPRLRDRLCLLIREHQLDPTLVKAYASDYCGTPALHNASREQVEAFINHLTECATNDRAALLCHLNSFAKPQEVSS